MATRQELINLLTECIKTEETSIPLYTQHIDNPEFLAAFKQQHVIKVKTIFETLKEGSQNHQKIFEGMLNTVTRSLQNVY